MARYSTPASTTNGRPTTQWYQPQICADTKWRLDEYSAASATGTVLASLLSPEALSAWGWRLPFILGLFVGLAGFALRRGLADAPLTPAAHPALLAEVSARWPLVLRLAGLSAFLGIGYYLLFLYMVSWLQTADGIAPDHALAIKTASILALLPATLVGGWLSDRIGRRTVLLLAMAGALAGSWPLFWLLHQSSSPMALFVGQAGFVLIVGLYGGTLSAALVEATPLRMRCMVVAIGYNVPLGILGGLTPMVATWLVARTADDLSPAWMLIAAAVVSGVATLSLPETFRRRFQTTPEPATA